MIAVTLRLRNVQSSYKLISYTRRKMSIDLEEPRIKHRRHRVIMETHLISKEPFGQFKAWLEEACNRTDIMLPQAMCLATATHDGIPSARIVVCKEYDKNGFKFFTDLESRKSKELMINPHVAATFYWPSLSRCIRIEGCVEKLSEEESTANFYSQPLISQIAANVSHQSTPIESREVLFERGSALEQSFILPVKKIPKPAHWGGFIIRPTAVEFYQGQRDHLHDRIRFRRPSAYDKPDGKLLHNGEDGWVFERLSP